MTHIELPPIAPQTNQDGSLHPQEKALLSTADIIVYGGEAGGGKTWVGAYFAGRWHHVPGYGALVTRRESPQITGSGGIWDQAKGIYKAWGAETTESPLNAKWENGARVEFRHMEHESSVTAHDGMQYGGVVLDEGQMYTAYMVWYLWGRCRTMAQIDGVSIKAQMLVTCNPDPDCFLRTLIGWWIGEDGLPIEARDGVVRWCIRLSDDDLLWFDTEGEAMDYVRSLQASHPDDAVYEHMRPCSITFIRSRLKDNRKMLEVDPTYGARLAMGDVITRSRKLGGNWNAKAHAGAFFNRSWFDVVDAFKWEDVDVAVRGWDIASRAPTPEYPNPDWTVGVLMLLLHNGKLLVADVQRVRESPGGVDLLVTNTVKADGPRVIQAFFQDPGSGGVRDAEYLTRIARTALPSVRTELEVAGKNKITYASPYSARLDPRTHHNQTQGYVLRASWNLVYFSELEAFGGEVEKDDQVDASSRAFLEIQRHTQGFAADFTKAMQRTHP